MIKLFSEIIGLPILLNHEKAQTGPITKIIINLKNGEVLGLLCFDTVEKKERAIPASEIVRFIAGMVVVREYNSISDPEDIVRLKEALSEKSQLVGKKVFTKNDHYLGKANDAAMDTKLLALDRIYVTPPYRLAFLAKDLIISAKKIIEIQPKKIIVSDEVVRQESKDIVSAPLPVFD